MEETEKKSKSRIDRAKARIVIISFCAGVLWLIALRFITLGNNEIHYHANFGLYLNGQQYTFNSFTYYEEVQSCGGDEVFNPKTRTHMHENINHIVHIHDAAATWGHFFANIGLVNGDTIFKVDDQTFVEDDSTKIRFMLNGQEVDTTANRTINSEDVLLISIGNPSDQDLKTQYDQIPKNAHEYNVKNDPASCSGGKPVAGMERLKQAIGVF